jgi:hypothetical protein
MGGDHKCPVCQATFTRPQHVARHMRSRTFQSLKMHLPAPLVTPMPCLHPDFMLFYPLLYPPSSRTYCRFARIQTLAIVLTNANIVEISLQGGALVPKFVPTSTYSSSPSDLLSRHVNKCHANEKPASNASSGSRRKGPASASRATTSKQACDQCVQSSLPCDGCNPCCT